MKQGFLLVGDISLTVVGPGLATASRATRGGASQVLVAATTATVLAPQCPNG